MAAADSSDIPQSPGHSTGQTGMRVDMGATGRPLSDLKSAPPTYAGMSSPDAP